MPIVTPPVLPPPPPVLERRYGTVDVCEITGWTQTTIHRRVREGTFPPPEIIGDVDRLMWRESVLAEWMEKNTHRYDGYTSPKVAAREAKRAARKAKEAQQ